MIQKESLEARDHRDAAVDARRDHRRLPRGRPARALREDDGLGRRGLRAHAGDGAAHRQAARDRLPAQLQHRSTRRRTRASSRPACSATSSWRASPGIATATGAAPAIRPPPTTIRRSGATRRGSTCSTGASTRSTSRGLLAELASHQVNISNWFFGAEPEAVIGTGGIYRFKDGREVDDHVYATFEYPGGRTRGVLDDRVERLRAQLRGVLRHKATLLLQGESEAYLFEEGAATPAAARPTGIDVQPKAAGPALVGVGEPRRRRGRTAGDRRRHRRQRRSAGGLSRPRSRASARRSAPARRCCAARIAPSDRRSPASPRSRPWPARRGCRFASGRPRTS